MKLSPAPYTGTMAPVTVVLAGEISHNTASAMSAGGTQRL